MIDVDHFKRFNDRYGHLAGDAALQAVARALNDVIKRPYDLLARYGGEEFVCVLPSTGQVEAVQIAERMQVSVRALQIAHLDSAVEQMLTVSLGVATVVPNSETTSDALLAEADRQLYTAKQAGRARISSRASPLPPVHDWRRGGTTKMSGGCRASLCPAASATS